MSHIKQNLYRFQAKPYFLVGRYVCIIVESDGRVHVHLFTASLCDMCLSAVAYC